MEFLNGQESLNSIQWILRAIVAFFYLLLITKIMGQRSISQLRLIDLMMALIIGNIIAHPLSDEQLGLKGSMITMAVLVTLYATGVYLSMKWNLFRRFLEPRPFPLIQNGKINFNGLVKAKISLDILLSELRKEKIEDIQKVSLALWEPSGKLSVFLDTPYKPLTPADMQFAVKPFIFPIPVIKEGKIDFEALYQLGKDEAWLKKKIKTMFAVEISNILLATIDNQQEIKIYMYN